MTLTERDDRTELDVESDRASLVGGMIEDAEAYISDAVGDFISALTDAGCFRIHRDWSASEERALAVKEAVSAAVQSVLHNGWVDLPTEVIHLHRKGA